MKGDIQQAIGMHELLYQVFLKYDFIPEAFTHKFDIHWGQNPLRPEFAESTYLLYKATQDPYYLKVESRQRKTLISMKTFLRLLKYENSFLGRKRHH